MQNQDISQTVVGGLTLLMMIDSGQASSGELYRYFLDSVDTLEDAALLCVGLAGFCSGLIDAMGVSPDEMLGQLPDIAKSTYELEKKEGEG